MTTFASFGLCLGAEERRSGAAPGVSEGGECGCLGASKGLFRGLPTAECHWVLTVNINANTVLLLGFLSGGLAEKQRETQTTF